MDLDKELLQKYTARSGITFDTIQLLEQAVVVLLPDSPNFETVFNMNMPTAIIAGDIKDRIKEKAQTIGYPDEAIIVKDNNLFRTLTGKTLFEGQNIPLSKIVAIANYIFENDVRPEIIVWKPEKDPPATPSKNPGEEIIYKEPFRQVEPIIKKPPFDSFPISNVPERPKTNIYLLKTVAEAESGGIAFVLNQKLNGLHLDITGKPFNPKYGEDKGSALSTKQYGYSPDGISVELASEKFDTVIYEIDADFLDSSLLQRLYDKSHRVYQVPSSFTRSIDSIQSWIGAQFRLDGIIATEDIQKFKQEWPNMTFTLDQVLQKL